MNDDEQAPAVEVYRFPPLDHTTILACELGIVRDLVPHLSPAGLWHVRAWLRHPTTVATAIAGVAFSRAALLDATCRRLAESDASLLEYFEGVRDVLPAAIPEDPSTIDTSIL